MHLKNQAKKSDEQKDEPNVSEHPILFLIKMFAIIE
jgi:hypothetical protein